MKKDSNMVYAVFILPFQLFLLSAVSCDGGRTLEETPVPLIPAFTISRVYPPCTAGTRPKCLVVCSVPSVPVSHLSWYNGSVSLSSLMISEFNTRLYLEVDYQDQNNYTCVLSSPSINWTKHLNIQHLCQSCRGTAEPKSVKEGNSVTLSTTRELQNGDDIMWFYRSALVAEYVENVTTYHHCDDGRFGNRLRLDTQTASLTISNFSEILSGSYKLLITNATYKECQSYNVTLYEHSHQSLIYLLIGVVVGVFAIVVVAGVVWFCC
ncbi:uncharacterized protein LOC130430567 [Triplophysa dalaica]|uniref:uncharacterized protein LOC130430567 n=1 Tax=Triplophysa dalaica TaxID=1582913 RepID=UPI0024DF5D9C|nr:uncharacterized protein LOC130430567 [Triplophysa dalaica]